MAPRRISRALGAATALALLLPAVASAHEARYTNPAATATSGDCSIAFPCRIDYAIGGASDGDNVVVGGGEYQIEAPIDAPAIDIAGEPGPRPVLVAASALADDEELLSFKGGGTLRHLSLRATEPDQEILVLEGGIGEDLEIVTADGGGAKVVGAPDTTVLRDSVVRTETAGDGDDPAIKLSGSGVGDVALRNVTVIAPGATAIRCDVESGAATLVNVIARGGADDVDATRGTACSAAYSNLRADRSPGLAIGDGIQSAEPRFADADLRTYADSPTADAGIDDQFVSAADPDGRERGTAPDIGAYEGWGVSPQPIATPEPTTTPLPEATVTPVPTPDPVVDDVPSPVLGTSVVVAPGEGKVLVRRPGSTHFVELGDMASLPVGTVVDARRGRIRLTTALDRPGSVQTGRFWGARFRIVQKRGDRGMTSLALRGGRFSRCPKRSSLARASGVAREYPARKVVRSLWARDHGGRFRTYGNNSVATARGTSWVTQDRCDGTVTRVREGSVAVRDRRAGRTVVVRAGHRYLARR